MSWQPGQPVVTEQDHVEWAAWRSDRKREQQRARRASNPRIDYYPDNMAAAVVNRLRTPYAGGDLSSIINRIVSEWAEARGRVPPE